MVQKKQRFVATSAESESIGEREVTVGSVWASNSYGCFTVLEFKHSKDVTVAFKSTGYKVSVTSDAVRTGLVKDRLSPTVNGVGFIGSGKFYAKSGGVETGEYKAWRNMLERCYSGDYQSRHPSYIGCSVCSDWHNYQNFAEWYNANHPRDGKRYQIDKDISIPGNKVYSPEGCLFVSRDVNAFTMDRGAMRGRFMIGASLNKRSGRFIANCRNSFSKKGEHIGCFGSELEAHLAWRDRKSELAYELAMIQDRDEVKRALLRWKLALDNFEIHKIDGIK